MTGPGLVFVHGGVTGERPNAPTRPSLSYALLEAVAVPSALEAVEVAIKALESDPRLNAGIGSVLNLAGELELDAGIVDGATGGWGGVANVRVKHPISLARRVLESTPHMLITGDGAQILGRDLEPVGRPTDEQQARWERARAEGVLDPERYPTSEYVDTVGAVALDANGRLAAGSSTGGVFGKMPGRVGDAPIFGAGIYASARAAIVGTGVGELFLETLASFRVGSLIEDGTPPQSACETVIEALGRRRNSSAGLLALDVEGRVGAAFRGSMWAVEGPDGPIEARQLK